MNGAEVDPEEGGALLDDNQFRNDERDPDKVVSVSSSEESDFSTSEEDKLPARSFKARLSPAWEEDRVLPAMTRANEVRIVSEAVLTCRCEPIWKNAPRRGVCY